MADDYIRWLETKTAAYLAEHPADDAESVTEDWRKIVGIDDPCSLIHWHLLTRGTARRLCADLGIELREGGK